MKSLMRHGATAKSLGELIMYRLVAWTMIVWIAICCAPYVYALNDLVTWW
jgi:hypothetical protein